MGDLATAFLESLKMEGIQLVTEYGFKILIALILYFVGFKFIKLVVKLVEVTFKKSRLDLSLSKFLISLIRMGLKVAIVLVIAAQIIEITPILALGAGASIGIGMAMQGSLANLTGGVLILLLRPFSIGDYISEKAFGNEGVVEDIQVFYTTLLTKDNKTVIIPNGQLANNCVINFTREKRRRVDLTFEVDYKEDPRIIREILLRVAMAHKDVLKDREVVANMEFNSEKGTMYNLWVWCESVNYMKVKYDLIEQIKLEFDGQNIMIPYPRMDVTISSMPKGERAPIE